jgi:hypothetical protein
VSVMRIVMTDDVAELMYLDEYRECETAVRQLEKAGLQPGKWVVERGTGDKIETCNALF